MGDDFVVDRGENEGGMKPYILVIDDDRDFLDLFNLLFGKWFEIFTSDTPETAISILKAQSFDAVLLDYLMPSIDGIQLLKQIKNLYPDLPVVIFSSGGSERLAREVFKTGADDYFNKDIFLPENAQIFKSAIDRCIKIRQSLRDEAATNLMFRHTFETLPLASAIITPNLVFKRINPQFTRILGYTQEDLSELNLEKIVHKDDMERNIERAMTCINDQADSFTVDSRFITKDGKTLWGRLFLTIHRDEKTGHPLFFMPFLMELEDQGKTQRDMEFFRSIISHVRDSIIVTDAGDRIIFLNEATEDLFKYKREELLGVNPDIFFETPLSSEEKKNVTFSLLRRKKWSGIYPGKRSDGSVFQCEFEVSPLFDEKGRLKYIVGIQRNVTERFEVQKALRESEERFRTIADYTYNWEYWIDNDENYLYISPSCERISGYSVEEFYANPKLRSRILHPDDQYIFALQVPDTETFTRDFRIIDKHGNVKWIDHSCHPVYDKEGNIIGRRGSNRDITDRKLMEQALKESRFNLARAQSIARLGNWSWDLETGEVEWSDEIFNILSVEPRIADNRILEERIDEEDVSAYREMLKSAVEDGKPFNKDLRINLDNSPVHCVNIQGEVTSDKSGKPIRIFGTIQDITERKNLEEELIAKNLELNEFAHRVSHDLKSPISSIKMYLGVLADNPELLERQLPRLTEQTDRLISFIDNLLRLSRAGRIIDRKESINLDRLIDFVFKVINGQDGNMTLQIDAPLPHILGDAGSVEEVLNNLFRNSSRYRDPEKPILEIRIWHQIRKDTLILHYGDNGSGISREHIGKIFVAGYTCDSKRGTGFGLAIVRKIIEAHGGRIEVRSAGKGKGTEFIIFWPLTGKSQA